MVSSDTGTSSNKSVVVSEISTADFYAHVIAGKTAGAASPLASHRPQTDSQAELEAKASGNATGDFYDLIQAQTLPFIGDPKCRLCCRSWADGLYESLQLKHRIAFNKMLKSKGCWAYTHTAVRSFGGGFDECVSYSFKFMAGGIYMLQWSRTFDQHSADNERQVGRWTVEGKNVRCETDQVPQRDDIKKVRYASKGRVFQVPIADIEKQSTTADEVPHCWEMACRGKVDYAAVNSSPFTENSHAVLERTDSEASTSASISRTQSEGSTPQHLRQDARFVEVDGDMVEVSADIVANCTEQDWPRMMRCRLRFGINGTIGTA